MKRDEIQKMREKNFEELKRDLESLKEELRNLKFDLSSGKLKNSNAIKGAKKKIAVIFTILNSKEDKHGK